MEVSGKQPPLCRTFKIWHLSLGHHGNIVLYWTLLGVAPIRAHKVPFLKIGNFISLILEIKRKIFTKPAFFSSGNHDCKIIVA